MDRASGLAMLPAAIKLLLDKSSRWRLGRPPLACRPATAATGPPSGRCLQFARLTSAEKEGACIVMALLKTRLIGA